MKENKTTDFYEFASYRLDVKNRCLMQGGKTVSLTPKEFELLLLLVENAGRTIEKDELLEKIWADTFVEEGTLTRNISWLRKKLTANDESNTQFIETLPKRGYRFLPEVTKSGDNDIIIEEQTIQHIHIEERVQILPSVTNGTSTIAIDELPEAGSYSIPAQTYKLLPAKATGRRFFYVWFILGFIALAAIGFAVYRIYFNNPEPKAIQIAKVAPFSGLPGRENQPAFSPDGKQITFSWNGGEQGDNTDIYIKLVGAGGEPVRLTNDRADEVSPTFAPDGKTIAFMRVLHTRSELILIPALGGAERKICDLRRSFSNISFSPDGLSLAVYDDNGSSKSGIFLVTIETGEKKRLTTPPDFAADDQPAFAPNGQSIAFIRSQQNAREVFIVPAAGGESRQLTFDKVWIGGIAWSADGERVIFSSQRKYNGQANLWHVDSSGNKQPEVIAISSERLGNLAVSPDKKTIAFVEEIYDTNIWRIEPSKISEGGASGKFAPSSRSDNSPNISPDGAHVVFASNRSGKYEIWIADANGTNVRQLTNLQGKSSAGSPRFSPDGKWIAFDAQVEGNGDIYVVSSNGGAFRRVTDSAAFDYIPAWSADGNSIYFVSNRSGLAQIYKMSVAGDNAKQITRNGSGGDLFESPDGKHLYFSKGKGSTEIWRVPTEGGDEENLSELTQAGYWRSWTLTKKGIYFVYHSAYPPYKIMFYDFSTGRAKEIAEVDAPPIWTYPGLGVSGDGKLILYAQNDQAASSIMLAEIEK